jgi:LuxR family transcriptional regulator, activator of conjugal transfer of Ti plasmids
VVEHLLQSVAGLRAAASLGAVQAELTSLLGSYGIDNYTHIVLRSNAPDKAKRFASNYPSAWISRYTEQHYSSVDPIVRASFTRQTPFTWGEISKTKDMSKRERAFMGEASECGLGAGMVVPIFGPNASFSVLSIAAQEDKAEFERYLVANQLTFHTFALYAHEAIERATSAAVPPEPPVHLYPREQECLLWVGRGKSSWEIGEILGISDETVKHYLKCAARKLGVNTRQHALTKAITLGVIQP